MFGPDNEIVVLDREVIAVLVPSGERVSLPEGTQCTITQALGGSYTVYIEGHLFRISGADADALGKEAEPEITLPEEAGPAQVEELVWGQLRSCYDPEIPIDIVELGLVYECRVEETEGGNRKVIIRMTLTAPGCGMGEVLVADVRDRLLRIPTVTETDIQLVFDPPWDQSMMSEAARLQAGLM